MPLSRYMEHVQSVVPDLITTARDFTSRFKTAEFIGLQTVESTGIDFMGKKWEGVKISALIRHPHMPYGVPMEVFMIAQPGFIDRGESVTGEWANLFNLLLQDDETIRTLGGFLN